jgi:opacity protein-like surface antigen
VSGDRLATSLIAACAVMLLAQPAAAQPPDVHGFVDVGATRFNASRSFDAVLGSPVGVIVGGGAGVTLPRNIFIDLRASRFNKDGRRVVADNGEVFDLGIANTVTITPLEITAGYRFGRAGDTLRPYAGGGISWYRYEETDQFATADERASEWFTGFHLLGGTEFRVRTWLGIAGELAWASIPNAIGQESGSVGRVFDETNLGGTTVRAKVVIGR